MKSKEKKHIKITLKYVITFFIFLISLLYIVIFYNFYFVKSKVYAKEVSSDIEILKISEAKKIDIDEIINKNVNQDTKVEYAIEETTLEYITKYINNANLAKGTMQVVQEGREGKQQITIKRTYQNEQLISEEQISSKITKGALNKIVEIGTANYTNNYKAKVGDNLYITSDRLSVMYEPNEQSQKVATLHNQDEIKVLEIHGDWYKISYSSIVRICKVRSYN